MSSDTVSSADEIRRLRDELRAAGEMQRTLYADARAEGAAAERERIRKLAIWMTTSSGTREHVVLADLLEETP